MSHDGAHNDLTENQPADYPRLQRPESDRFAHCLSLPASNDYRPIASEFTDPRRGLAWRCVASAGEPPPRPVKKGLIYETSDRGVYGCNVGSSSFFSHCLV